MSADRVAIVSGATGAIGAATCRALAAAGCHVVVGYRSDAAAAAALADELAPDATAVHLDVTDPASGGGAGGGGAARRRRSARSPCS